MCARVGGEGSLQLQLQREEFTLEHQVLTVQAVAVVAVKERGQLQREGHTASPPAVQGQVE